MKTKLFLGAVAMAMFVGMTTTQAQRRQFNNPQGCLLQDELTQEQKDKLDDLRIAFYQKTQADHNQLNELMAKKRTLETTDPVNKEALFDCLASINAIQTKIQKERVRHFQEVKSNLSDEQVILFDSRNKGWMNNAGPGKRQGQGRGNGSGKGYGNQQKGQGYGQGGRGQGNGQGYGRGQRQGRGNGQGQGYRQGRGQRADALELTDAQKAFIEKSRVDMLSKEQDLKNKVNELNASIKTQTTGKAIDLKSVDKLISQKAELNLQMAQLRADHRMEVRNQLTAEQKIKFDHRGFNGRGRRANR